MRQGRQKPQEVADRPARKVAGIRQHDLVDSLQISQEASPAGVLALAGHAAVIK